MPLRFRFPSFTPFKGTFGTRPQPDAPPAAGGGDRPFRPRPGAGAAEGGPPRRAAAGPQAGTDGSARARDRRGVPPSGSSAGRPAGHAQTHGGRPAASPAQKLLQQFRLAEIDRMTDAQLLQVVEFLAGPQDRKHAVPIAANWKRLRGAFSDQEVRMLLLNSTAQTVDFLMAPAAGGKPQGGKTGDAPGGGPRSDQGARAGRPQAPRQAAQKPLSVVGMDHGTALQALRDRGMTDGMLRGMKQDVLQHVRHGGQASGEALNRKYRAFVSDDFTSSAVYASYVRLLQKF